MKVKPKDKPHYVNNAQFSNAVVEYVKSVDKAAKDGLNKPVIPNYVAGCFLKIAEGLSHKANFVRYTYREEMVMDAVENCLKAIENYDITKATRTEKPNAFAYFTQISWYAFLRRIQKEKKQQDIRLKYIAESGLEQLISEEFENNAAARETNAYVDNLKVINTRLEHVKESDEAIKLYAKKEKKRRESKKYNDSDLTEFMQ